MAPPDPSPTKPARHVIAVRVMAGVCIALALMCAGLAWAWKTERDKAECWRAFGEYQLQPEGACGR